MDNRERIATIEHVLPVVMFLIGAVTGFFILYNLL